jgi:hypothetical protein
MQLSILFLASSAWFFHCSKGFSSRAKAVISFFRTSAILPTGAPYLQWNRHIFQDKNRQIPILSHKHHVYSNLSYTVHKPLTYSSSYEVIKTSIIHLTAESGRDCRHRRSCNTPSTVWRRIGIIWIKFFHQYSVIHEMSIY